ncbi:TIGR03087 family PEP-CTERM/XrtA system glycosyltransferase [Neptunicella marina]|uniref:TIGR03087 family PEP-CTERM/XrtA system glycosyltransferase n=1 Tax=Neptunicella marina TaxID=2125989 RepID=A0A8J6M1U7_9ALTE|nr:TIGR03087 family PEP-CTERM/XrtA system glycosyltransferase [Neptunicella marina]MBC3765757.1 TIGR03087 family PEP-CTERM/XrtA system glycosyltransferase [Neptunicella marina]
MNKPSLLYLVHRIPYPPNKGDKIRSYNILCELNKHFDVHCVCFIDDAQDQQYISVLEQQCASLYVENLNKKLALVKSATGLITGKALSIPYYRSRIMQAQVDKLIQQHKIKHALVFSSTMGQFIYPHPQLNVVTDFVDVDSDKWRQYAQQGNLIKRWIYQREHQKLQQEEQTLCERSAWSLFVSPQEAGLFRQLMPSKLSHKIGHCYNGVDTEYFSPTASDIVPLKDKVDICFTGAMDYWANVDAVLWFVQHVWAQIVAQRPDTRFFIVGGNPSEKVKALAAIPGIVVTGRVKDVRPYVLAAKINVAPLQIARGIQNKVLEAMSLAKPVICTSLAIEGIDARNQAIFIADKPEQFAQIVLEQLDAPADASCSRLWITENLQWDATLAGLQQKLLGEDTICN